jgi:hypothetical protein
MSMQVLVFKTSVESHENVSRLAPMLNKLAGDGKWNFALDDCDRILRIASKGVRPDEAIGLLGSYGFLCQELD